MSFSQFNAFSRCKPIQQIDLVDLFCKISNQKIDVVLRDVQIVCDRVRRDNATTFPLLRNPYPAS